MEQVRWGVLGVADHFRLRVYVPTRDSDSVKIHGIASRQADKAKKAAREFGIPKSYGSYEDLLKDDDIEAVFIPLPNHMHVEWIKKTADAGKHILCEKPLAMSAKEATEGIEYAKKKGVMLMEAFMHRFHPQVEQSHTSLLNTEWKLLIVVLLFTTCTHHGKLLLKQTFMKRIKDIKHS